jgi:membrane-associated phospholipid phosphatase
VRDQLARWISILAHPFVVSLLLIGSAAVRFVGAQNRAAVIFSTVSIVILPLGWFMYHQTRCGRWKNVDASDRSERPVLYALALILTAALGLYLFQNPATRVLARGAFGMLGLLIAGRALNAIIKSSMHVAVLTFAAVLLCLIEWKLGLALAILVPAVAWARVAMQRHSWSEVSAGLLMGVGAAMAARFL